MNKLDLIEALKAEAGLTKNEATAIVNLFFDEMSNALANGDRVEIRGLCSFYVKKYKEYTGRNPKTGEKVKIKPKKLPFFKCGTELRERVDI
jgi:integration host factor subunit beta